MGKKAEETIMRKSYLKTCAMMTMTILLFTGCGAQLPELTAEEELQVSEYAAKILLEYDANNRSRLVSLEKVVEWEQKQQEKQENALQQPGQGGMQPVENTPVIELGQETASGITTGTIEEFYSLPEGVKVVYQGNEVCDSYSPDGGANHYFAMDAKEGKKLLVLKFNLENQSQVEQKVSMLSQSAQIRLTVNGNGYNVLMTMLMEDLSTYVGSISAGGTVETVLIAEADSDAVNEITSLGLSLKSDAKGCTIQLQ